MNSPTPVTTSPPAVVGNKTSADQPQFAGRRAALLISTLLLGESPHCYHGVGLVTIAAGIGLAQRR